MFDCSQWGYQESEYDQAPFVLFYIDFRLDEDEIDVTIVQQLFLFEKMTHREPVREMCRFWAHHYFCEPKFPLEILIRRFT